MNSGQTSSPLPSFKSLRCFRWGVRVFLGPESECFGLSSEDEDIDGKKSYDEKGEKKRIRDGLYTCSPSTILSLVPGPFCKSKKGTETR